MQNFLSGTLGKTSFVAASKHNCGHGMPTIKMFEMFLGAFFAFYILNLGSWHTRLQP